MSGAAAAQHTRSQRGQDSSRAALTHVLKPPSLSGPTRHVSRHHRSTHKTVNSQHRSRTVDYGSGGFIYGALSGPQGAFFFFSKVPTITEASAHSLTLFGSLLTCYGSVCVYVCLCSITGCLDKFRLGFVRRPDLDRYVGRYLLMTLVCLFPEGLRCQPVFKHSPNQEVHTPVTR